MVAQDSALDKYYCYKYQQQGFNVERYHLEHRLELRKKGKFMKNKMHLLPVIDIINVGTVISNLTDASIDDKK